MKSFDEQILEALRTRAEELATAEIARLQAEVDRAASETKRALEKRVREDVAKIVLYLLRDNHAVFERFGEDLRITVRFDGKEDRT